MSLKVANCKVAFIENQSDHMTSEWQGSDIWQEHVRKIYCTLQNTTFGKSVTTESFLFRITRILWKQNFNLCSWKCANRFLSLGMPRFPIWKELQICINVASCCVYTLIFYNSHPIVMPKTRLFNLKNLGSWAGIKKKKKNDGNTEVVASDKENVCLLYSPRSSHLR